MYPKIKHIIEFLLLILVTSVFFTSCNYTKHLGKNEYLLKSNSLSIKVPKTIKYKGEFESSILSLIKQQPNTHMFDLDNMPKYKLWKYNNRYEYFKKNPDDVKIVKKKVEKPVILDTALISLSKGRIKQFMINQGYYSSLVESEIKYDSINKLASVIYKVVPGKSYYIKNVSFTADSLFDKNNLSEIAKLTVLKKGDVFTNNTCGMERERIYRYMKKQGYYDFKNDNTNFIVDTNSTKNIDKLLDDPFESSINYTIDTLSNDSINVAVSIQKVKESTYNLQYTIDSVIVNLNEYGNNVFNESNAYLIHNSLDNIYFNYNQLPINRKLIIRNIFLQPNEIYDPQNQERTINRLNELNVFKIVNVYFKKDTFQKGKLVCFINLSMNDKYELIGQGDVSTSDGDYLLGLGGSILFKNKNLFLGGNQLQLKAASTLQYRQYDNSNKIFFSGGNVSFTANVIFPKFIVPFNPNTLNKRNLPFSILSFNSSYVNRYLNYSILNLSGSFGYSWRETVKKSWRFNPTFLTLNIVPDALLSQNFKSGRDTNQYLRSIFSSYIINGENANFEYKSIPTKLYGSTSTLKVGIEEAGTFLSGVNVIYKSIFKKDIERIAKYIRVDVDYRKYFNYRKSQWANRLMIGVGMPYENDKTLPYIKQFSSGGPFSIRGWSSRTLGPGRSNDLTAISKNSYVDKTGDIKLEANSEYRFNLLKLFSGVIVLKGATFIDAGNVWLFNKAEDLPGGNFDINYLWQDIAIAAGGGLRFDFSFFVFRFDVGYPIKDPTVFTNGGFIFNDLKITTGKFNFAINYPF